MKYFSVPVNEEGQRALNSEEDSFYIHDYEMSQDEFERFVNSGLLHQINETCDLTLQEGKRCWISFQQADEILQLLSGTEFESSEFAGALVDAIYFLSGVDCML